MPAPVADAFAKGHALGNDYLVVEPAHLSFALTPAMVRRLCDRHRGVGSDGVLALVPSDHADAGLRIYNPDGSEAEKSGNGLRIFARWLVETGRVAGDRFRVETPGGLVECRINREDGRIVDIGVDMGRASFRSDDVPCSGPSREVVAEPVEVAGTVLRVTAVGIGNPHCVVFVDDPTTADLGRLGPALENHPLFPRRTNVQLARVVGARPGARPGLGARRRRDPRLGQQRLRRRRGVRPARVHGSYRRPRSWMAACSTCRSTTPIGSSSPATPRSSIAARSPRRS